MKNFFGAVAGILCAFLGITTEMLEAEAPYVRVLAFNDRGREILSDVKKEGFFVNAGQPVSHPLWDMEQRWEDLYGLFQAGTPGQPGAANRRRVVYIPG